MKYIKMLGALAAAATALMALTGSASAAYVTSSEGETPNIVATSTNSKFHGSFVSLECAHSKLEGNVESHGVGVPVGLAVDALSFSNCNYVFTVVNKGSLQIHADPSGVTGDGTITWTGAIITYHSSVGQCTLTTNGTDVGTLDGKASATWHINSAKIPRTAGNFLCGSSATWTGNYSITNPSTLEVH
jgi:hypothetical protein